MRVRKKYIIFLVAICSLLVSVEALAADFKPLQHKWSMGGQANIPWYVTMEGTMGFNLSIEPSVNYFILDGWELSLSSHLSTILTVNDPFARDQNPVHWGFGAYSRYYFDVGRNFFPYAGVFFGFDMTNNYPESFEYEFGAGPGLLLLLNDSIALDFGLVLKGNFVLRTFRQAQIIPAVLGFRYFF